MNNVTIMIIIPINKLIIKRALIYNAICLIFIINFIEQRRAPLTDKIQVEVANHGQTIQAGRKKNVYTRVKIEIDLVHYNSKENFLSTIPRHAHPSKS